MTSGSGTPPPPEPEPESELEPEPERKDSPAAPGAPTARWQRFLKIALGVLLVPVGIVGLFVPVLQGVILLFLAVALLASEVPVVARLRDRLRERYPTPFERMDQMKKKLKERFRR